VDCQHREDTLSSMLLHPHRRRVLGRLWEQQVLWSLRSEQQDLLWDYLPPKSDRWRLEIFTHPTVRVFLSHCGWGGITDIVSAGVLVLA
jgi:hypothetical protein